MSQALPPRLQAMLDELAAMDDLTDKYEVLIELGAQVPDIAVGHKTDANLIKGCQSLVHVYAECRDGRIHFYGHADAMVVNGLLALLVQGLSGLSPAEFLSVDPGFIIQSGIIKTLTPSRVNGFYNIHQRLRLLAEACLKEGTS